MAKKKNEELEANASPAEENVEETPAEVTAQEAEPKAEKKAADAPAADKAEPVEAGDVPAAPKKGKRAERIGVVASDKMTKTVVVRVDRIVKHPTYRKYVRQGKRFMAHDELGAKTGDKVRIVETRPLSARKRWRVVEIIQKAEL